MSRDLLAAAVGAGAGAALAVWCCRRAAAATDGKRMPRTSSGTHRSGRYVAGMIKAVPELIHQYMQLHDHTWDEVMEKMYAV